MIVAETLAPRLSEDIIESRAPAHIKVNELAIYYGKKLAVNGISLSLHRGKITALIGPSGCGKTSFLTTLNQLSKLNNQVTVTGEIHFDGENLTQNNVDLLSLRRRVGMIFQKPNPFPLSIFKNLDIPLKEHGFKNRAERIEKIENALKAVGLWDEVKDRLNTSALSLSGGQQQRLCIARALVLEPEVLLMDEPCSALDPISSGIVEELISSLRDKYTVVIVTHNLAQAKRISDYTAFFWTQNGAGKLIEFNNTRQLFSGPKDERTAAYISGIKG
ncbi:phosphate ABC transporter ATP-binding protein PstB [Sessilibacter sp. MAH2]